jgi:hypothetical protein
MSSRQNYAALVDRLFARFVALYGSQKVGAMWADADLAEVKMVWAVQLSRFNPQSIKVALQCLIDSGREWPPTLPEFIEACRQAALGRQQRQVPALLAPGQGKTDAETAKREVAKLIATLASSKRLA